MYKYFGLFKALAKEVNQESHGTPKKQLTPVQNIDPFC